MKARGRRLITSCIINEFEKHIYDIIVHSTIENNKEITVVFAFVFFLK